MTAPLDIHRGELWLVSFDPTRGSEIQKTRPAVVLNVDTVGRLPLRIVVPITDWKAHYAELVWFTHIAPIPSNGLTKDSGADAFQIKSVSVDRFLEKLGSLEAAQLEDIAASIALCVGYAG
jgi:mRNA interferase MazF